MRHHYKGRPDITGFLDPGSLLVVLCDTSLERCYVGTAARKVAQMPETSARPSKTSFYLERMNQKPRAAGHLPAFVLDRCRREVGFFFFFGIPV